MKGKIIVIEGIDGSGKNTQTNLVLSYLTEKGIKASKISFPAYDETFFGREVGNYLNGKFGELDKIHPKLCAMLYAGDRFEKLSEINQKLNDGYLLVIDRYVPSNIAHQASKFEGMEREALAQWIEELEYRVYGLPKPDMVIFLDVPPHVSQKLVLKKEKRTYTDKKADLHEENKSYLEKVYEYFCEIAFQQSWTHIRCFQQGKIRTEDDIFSEIKDVIDRKFF